MNIVGISSYYHDSAVCLLQEGHLIAAAQQERFSRRKHDPRLPIEAFLYCLQEGKITLAEVDCIAYYERPDIKLERQIWSQLPRILANGEKGLGHFDASRPLREIKEVLGFWFIV
jgi:carbamoyltransferase